MSLLQRKDVRGNGAGGRGAQRAVGERSAGAAAPPDPELVERPQRRRFTAEYKIAVLREANGLTRPGEIGALLRRERASREPASRCARQVERWEE